MGRRLFYSLYKAKAQRQALNNMNGNVKTMAQQVAQAARKFQQERTGHAPTAVTVVISEGMVVITLHGALTPAEQALAAEPEGAAKVQEFHRHLFANASNELRAEIKRITGVEVKESAAEVETRSGTVIHAFTNGTVVQVFQLAGNVAPDSFTVE